MVVDRFSKGFHLGMLPTHHTLHTITVLFMDMVDKIHGRSRSLTSDRDPLFLSQFWQALFKLSGTCLRMSLAYHPQSDGQTEVLNRVIEQCLRAFVHNKPSLWGKFLGWVEWAYNTSCHSSTGVSPYEVTLDKKPFNFPQYLAGTSNVEAVNDLLSNMEVVFAKIRKKLLKAQEGMKHIADAKRRDATFNPRDWVIVKLRPHRQTSASRNTTSYSKLAKRYYDPYQILERIGKVVYKLQLPEGACIHPVFHCSFAQAVSQYRF